MRNVESVSQIGLDAHRRFSMVTARDTEGRILWRERLRHEDRPRLREALTAWPKGVPVVMEATFGWGWLSDELAAAGLELPEPIPASAGWDSTVRLWDTRTWEQLASLPVLAPVARGLGFSADGSQLVTPPYAWDVIP